MIVLLDSGPVGLLAHSRFMETPAKECNEWAEAMLHAGHRLFVPGIIDCEVRGELNRLGNQLAIARLNLLPIRLGYHFVSVNVLNRAAQFWAIARRNGTPTADRQSLDIDMIPAGHAAIASEQVPQDQIVIATSNVRHLRLFEDARDWAAIT